MAESKFKPETPEKGEIDPNGERWDPNEGPPIKLEDEVFGGKLVLQHAMHHTVPGPLQVSDEPFVSLTGRGYLYIAGIGSSTHSGNNKPIVNKQLNNLRNQAPAFLYLKYYMIYSAFEGDAEDPVEDARKQIYVGPVSKPKKDKIAFLPLARGGCTWTEVIIQIEIDDAANKGGIEIGALGFIAGDVFLVGNFALMHCTKPPSFKVVRDIMVNYNQNPNPNKRPEPKPLPRLGMRSPCEPRRESECVPDVEHEVEFEDEGETETDTLRRTCFQLGGDCFVHILKWIILPIILLLSIFVWPLLWCLDRCNRRYRPSFSQNNRRSASSRDRDDYDQFH